MKTLLYFMVLTFSATSAWSRTCPELERFWYDVFSKDFKVDLEKKEFKCKGLSATVAQAFYDLYNIQYENGTSLVTPDFFTYVKKNIHSVNYNKSCDSIAEEYQGVITICPHFKRDSREDRASTIVHEARHVDADDTGHVRCIGGKYDGKLLGCDKDFYNGELKGSGFNADVHFLGWALKRKKNELSLSVTRSHIKWSVPDRFNNISTEDIQRWRTK